MNLKMLKKAMLAYVSAVKFIWSGIAYPLSIMGKKLMNLRGYRVYGNSIQDGTPTPDNPVEIECVGDLSTKNLFDISKIVGNVDTVNNNDGTLTLKNNYSVSTSTKLSSACPALKVGDTITFRAKSIVSDGSNSYKAIYLSTSKSYWSFNNSYTVTESDLDSILYFYNGTSTTAANVTTTISDIQIELGTTATDYEPYHKYKIPVVARGKNMIPMFTFNTFTQNGVTFTNNKDGSITLNGTPTGYAATPVISLPKSSLEVLRNNACVLTGFYNYQKNITLTLDARLNGSSVKTIMLYMYSYKDYVTVDLRDVTFDSVRFSIKRQTDNQLIDNVTVKPFLEVGTTMPTSFEPYIAPVTTNIFLDSPLRKVGDYADYVDYEKQKVVRNVEVLDDTGTKTIDESLGVINPPTEETVNLPALPQFKGTTIYEVDTNIKPSGMEAKYC